MQKAKTGLAAGWIARRATRARGVALVIVLCSLFVLSVIVFGLARRIEQSMIFAGRDNRGLEARALAFSGLQIALHPQSSIKTPALHAERDRAHGYRARIVGEGGRIQLNWILAGQDPVKLDLLKSYLESKGLNFQEREILVDCLLDWVTPGDLTHLNGSATAIDGSPRPGKPFQDLAEVRRVVGSEPLTQQSGWENDFTLLSRGPIDLQWASEELIGALPGVGESRARVFVQHRRGPDRLDGTPDDVVLGNPQEAAVLLGMNPEMFANIQNLVTVGDPTVRIISTGRAVDVTRTVEVVARKEGMQPQILQWKEY